MFVILGSVSVVFISIFVSYYSYSTKKDKERLTAEYMLASNDIEKSAKDSALSRLQNIFNQNSGIYKKIAGAKILAIVKNEPEKTEQILKIITKSTSKSDGPMLDIFNLISGSKIEDFKKSPFSLFVKKMQDCEIGLFDNTTLESNNENNVLLNSCTIKNQPEDD